MKKAALATLTILLACLFLADGASAGEDKTAERLLAAADGLQMPSSESDSLWEVVAYPGVERLPDADRFGELTGCPAGKTIRSDFDETLARLSEIEPWMDPGQVRSARGFRKLEKVFGREFGEKLAVYRCESGSPEVNVYFLGVQDDRILGLMTVSIET